MNQAKIRELNEQRGQNIEQAKHLAALDNRTEEQEVQLDALLSDEIKLEKEVNRLTALDDAEAKVADALTQRAEIADKPVDQVVDEDKKYREVFSKFMRGGHNALDAGEIAVMNRNHIDIQGATTPQTVTTTGGGYLIPQDFANEIEVAKLAYGGVRNISRVITTATGNTLPWPTVDDTSNTGELLAINTAAGDGAVTFGQTSFGSYTFSSKEVLVPFALMQDSAFSLDSFLAAVLGERLGRIQNTYQTTGTGSSQPEGCVNGSTAGKTTAAIAAVTAAELLDLKHSVDPSYRENAHWMFKDSTLLAIKKLVDSDGRFLWSSGLAYKEPDTIDGDPYVINQSMAALGTGNKFALYGDFSKYVIREVAGYHMMRLNERYANALQVAFIAFQRSDAKVLDAGTAPIKHAVNA